MKKAFIITALALMLCGLASAETIKVLILDGNFKDVPDKGEKLAMIDSLKGELLIGYTRYKGNIEVWKGEKGLYLISEVPLEEYVEGVTAAELGEDWDIEAIKAQAVVARTYALNRKMQSGDAKFHLTSSVLHQVFKGMNANEKVARAVAETSGEVLLHGGKPIEAFYHSTCGGTTEEPEEVFGKNYSYIKSVKTECNLSPYQMWSRNIPISELEDALGVKGISDVRVKSRTSTGRVKTVAVISGTNHTFDAAGLRKKLGWKRLPSTDFTVKVEGDSVLIEGRGYGHGVGLCQWGTLEMAKKGASYKDILSKYFSGALLKKDETR